MKHSSSLSSYRHSDSAATSRMEGSLFRANFYLATHSFFNDKYTSNSTPLSTVLETLTVPQLVKKQFATRHYPEILIIIIVSFMQGIYTYIPETNYVPREYSVAAILLLLFMVLISLVSVLNLLYFYISTFRSM